MSQTFNSRAGKFYCKQTKTTTAFTNSFLKTPKVSRIIYYKPKCHLHNGMNSL